MIVKIATIITCFNRKEKTVSCLTHLFETADIYNSRHPEATINLSVYLTDDGCTDGTAEAVKAVCKDKDLHIIQGDGNCFWAGGMRLAWNEALKSPQKWDYYLLLNDDTIVFNNVFDELFQAHRYALTHYKKGGLYSGITCDLNHPDVITYGGERFNDKINAEGTKVTESKQPQVVDQTNANILLIHKDVVNQLGIFYKDFIHGGADYDYSMQAKKHGFPVLVTAHSCGACEYDHLSGNIEINKLKSMSWKERRIYMSNPIHSDQDYFLYIKRNLPHKYFLSKILRNIRWVCPSLYGQICKLRKLKDYKKHEN